MEQMPSYSELTRKISELESSLENARAQLDRELQKRTGELMRINKSLTSEIRQRKLAEQSSRKNEELFRTLTEHSQDLIMRIDRDLVLIYANRNTQKFFGVPAGQIIGKKISHPAIAPFFSEFCLKTIEIVFNTGELQRVEFRLQNGLYVDCVCVPERSDTGEVGTVLASGRDITDIKHTETALQNSEDRFRAYAESSKSAIFMIQGERFIYVNRATQELSGYSENELLAMKFSDLVHPDMKTLVQERAEARQGGQTPPDRYEIHAVKKNGQDLWLDMAVTVLDYKGGKSIFGTAFDITESTRAKEALVQSENRYRTILETIEEGYFEVDLAGNLTFFNDALCRITGMGKEKLLGVNNREYTTPETARRMFQTFNQVFRTREPAMIAEYEIIGPAGEPKVFELSTSLITDQKGQPIGFRGIARDKTTKLKLEKERQLLEKQLQQALRMEAIGTLAGGIAHDFNNLLTSIQGNVSIIKIRTDPSHSNFEKLRRIEDLVQSGADLTKQLLGFAMGGKYEVRTTALNELLRNSLKMINRTRKDIVIHEDYTHNLWNVDVDRSQIEQVMLNLYVNAAHAMPNGGELRLRTRNFPMDESTARQWELPPGRYIEISLSDTGIGMEKETLERIFEPFFTTKEMGRGTGLGLASAYGIIKNHKGRISAVSTKGQGSTFFIYLPASEKAEKNDEETAGMAGEGRGTILLVDDEEDVREVGREILNELGYEVITAQNGREAVALLNNKKNRIDLIILDIIMPDLSGPDTFEALRTVAPDMKILLSSGYSINEQAIEMMTDGNCAFIHKPFNLRSLSQHIRNLLNQNAL